MLDIVVIRRILPTFGEKGVERQEGFPRDVARGRRQLEPAVRTRETRQDTGQRRARPAGASLVPSGGLEAPLPPSWPDHPRSRSLCVQPVPLRRAPRVMGTRRVDIRHRPR